MHRWSRYLVGVVAVTGLLLIATSAGAETLKLEVKRIDPNARPTTPAAAAEYRFRSVRPQSFFQQIGGRPGMISGPTQGDTPTFEKLIQKEPSKYNAKKPFKGVAQLGTQYFGFVFDEPPPKEGDKPDEPKKDVISRAAEAAVQLVQGQSRPMEVPKFDRLFFDVNHNGDLTDDAVVEAMPMRAQSNNYHNATFPRVDLTIDVDGTPVEYAFMMSLYAYGSTSYSYANASLSAAAYREGETTLDGRKRRVVVVDFNSNGRFDDASKIDDRVRLADGSVYPSFGDMLYVLDPAATGMSSVNPYDPTASDELNYIGKLVNIEGGFYDLQVSPSGDQISLSPSSLAVGHVHNANQGYRAIVYGDAGFLKVIGNEEGQAPLPEGEWKLASYTIDVTDSKPAQPAEAQETGLLDYLRRALVETAAPATARPSTVSARAKADYPAVKIAAGQTVELPFGAPFKPVVTASPRGQGMVSLSMALVGAAGESCSNMTVNGARPGKPQFTITTTDGEEVGSGSFEYG